MATKYPETLAFIRKYGNSVESEIETRLKNNGKYASGKLYKSIRYEVVENKNDFLLTFFMADYGTYVDKGVNGYERNIGGKFNFKDKSGTGTGSRSKFIESLKKWCRIKGIPEGAAFPIRRNIWKYGIAPTNFFTIPTKRREKFYIKGVEEAMARDMDKQIQKAIDKNGNN